MTDMRFNNKAVTKRLQEKFPELQIGKAYSPNTKVLGRKEGFIPVKTLSGQMWIKEAEEASQSVIVTEQDWQLGFRGIDTAHGSRVPGLYDTGIIEELWNNADDTTKRKMVNAFRDFDWEELWRTKYNPQIHDIDDRGYEEIRHRIKRVFPEFNGF